MLVIKKTASAFNEKKLVKLEELIADQGHHPGLFFPSSSNRPLRNGQPP